jgi:hypothetical protein
VKIAEITPQGGWGNAELFGERVDIHPAMLAQEVEDLAVPFVSEHERMRGKRARTIKNKIRFPPVCLHNFLVASREWIGVWKLGGQFILNAGCAIPASIPPENVFALVRAAEEFGQYATFHA